jgi:hypothetical protein
MSVLFSLSIIEVIQKLIVTLGGKDNDTVLTSLKILIIILFSAPSKNDDEFDNNLSSSKPPAFNFSDSEMNFLTDISNVKEDDFNLKKVLKKLEKTKFVVTLLSLLALLTVPKGGDKEKRKRKRKSIYEQSGGSFAGSISEENGLRVKFA